MKNVIFLSSFFFFFSSTLFSQVEGFKLRDYKTTDLKRQTLALGGNFRNDIRGSKIKTTTPSIDRSQNISLNASADFTQFTNTRKLQRLFFVSTDGSYRWSKDVSSINPLTKSNSGELDLFISSDNRRYFTKNKFIELNGRGIFSPSISKDFANESWSTSKRMRPDLTLEIGVGKGRLESIEAAHYALFMMKAFKDSDLLGRHLNPDDIKQIADRIDQLENDRFFDSRIKRINQIVQLDALFQEMGILVESNALSTATLIDQWFGTRFIVRRSGARFSAGIISGLEFNWRIVDLPAFGAVVNEQSLITRPGIYFDYTYSLPVNLNWQHTFNSRLDGQKNWDKDVDNPINETRINELVVLIANYRLNFYPNTRTVIGATLSGQQSFMGQNGSIFDEDVRQIQFSGRLSIDAQYYLSPQVRLFGDVSYSNFDLNLPGTSVFIDDFHNWAFRSSLGATIYIF